MENKMRHLPVAGVLLYVGACAAALAATASQTLNVSIGAVGKLSVVQSSVSLIHTGSTFADFTGSATVQYKIRTTTSTGNASLTVQAAADFAPANGPSVANSDLVYTCSGASLGTGCSGTQTVKTSSQTNVVTVGSGACTGSGCSGTDPNAVTVNLDLTDSPAFKTGSYSTNLTFTISSL